MKKILLGLSLLLCAGLTGFAQDQGPLWPRHIETPFYPAIAKTAHVQGKMVLALTIDENGKVADVKVVSGPKLFELAATGNIRQWTFEKPTVAPHMQTITYDFELVDVGQPAKISYDLPDRVNVQSPPPTIQTITSSPARH